MKLVSWNVNGIRSIYKKGFEEYVTQSEADCICLQETKAHPEQLSPEQLAPAGYHSHFSSAEKKGYSGVATLRGPGVECGTVAHGIQEPRFDNEGRFLITPLTTAQGNSLLLYNIYFPSGSSGEVRQDYKYEFLDCLFDHLKGLPKKKRESLIVCGDFNICHREIDIHHPKEAARKELSGFLPEERAWMDRFAGLGFVDTFRHIAGDVPDRYSWWTYRAGARGKNKGWRIDYIFVAEALAPYVRNATIEASVLGSDHCPVTLELDY